MKEKRTNVLEIIADVGIIALTITGLVLIVIGIVNFSANATNVDENPVVQQDNDDGFVPPPYPTETEFIEKFGYPLVYTQKTQTYDFFVEPSFYLDALLTTADSTYIVDKITYRVDLSGLSYYLEIEYTEILGERQTAYLYPQDSFMIYLMGIEENQITPDVENFLEFYFYDYGLQSYIGFLAYYDSTLVPQYEVYYNDVLNKLGSTQFGQNMLLSIITAPYNVLDSFTLFEANGVNISLWNVLVTCIGIAMFIWFIKMFAGG